MQLTLDDLILVTGATGLVGSHVCQSAQSRNLRVRALVRSPQKAAFLTDWGVETVEGDMTDAAALEKALDGVTVVVHCAAKVGDWGPVEEYREVNVLGLQKLLDAALAGGTLDRFVHISSLGVYPAQDHYGTDESMPPSASGIDGYTLSKVESEALVMQYVQEKKLPAVVLRPGFIYGPRDATVLPKVIERLKNGSFKFLGSGEKLVNNTYVGNLVEAIWLAIEHDEAIGEVYNIRDPQLVSKKEFFTTIAKLAGCPVPQKHVPLGVAKILAKVMEMTARLTGRKSAPLLNSARIKFLGLNLDFSIDKAQQELGYQPSTSFADGMKTTIDWFRSEGLI